MTIQASQMLNQLYQEHLDQFNQTCEQRLKSPEVQNEFENQLHHPNCQHSKV